MATKRRKSVAGKRKRPGTRKTAAAATAPVPVAAPQAATVPTIRNRIKAHVTVRAGDLVPHELNPRRHPDAQRAALRGMYREIGFARSLLAYELPDGRLKLVDGHLRQEMDPEMMVTVEVLDLTDAEAKLMLAATDPLSAMAAIDPAALALLLPQIDTECDELQAMLDALAASAPVPPAPGLTDPDAVPEAPAVPVTEAGDLWLLGAFFECEDCGKKYEYAEGLAMKECPCG
jgi:hypothetical protein